MKKCLLALCVLICAITCVGCGGGTKQELWVYNQTDFISGDVLEKFEKETGIKVVYNTYGSSEEMYARISENPEMYDVVFARDYMVSRLVKEDALLPLDATQIPGITNVDAKYKGLYFDTKNTYSVPYLAGTMGILYDANRVSKPESWNILWSSQYRSEILMLNSQRDGLAIALLASGYGVNAKDAYHIDVARVKLQRQLSVVKWYQTYEIKDNMAQGRAQVAAAFSNDAVLAEEKALRLGITDLKYVIPKEGSNQWVSSMVVPKRAKNSVAAMKFINYLSQNETCAANSAASGGTPVMAGARRLLPDSMQNSTAMFPAKEQLDMTAFYDYDVATNWEYEKAWRLLAALK